MTLETETSEYKITYKHPYSKDIAEFNYSCNLELLQEFIPSLKRENEISDILYVCSLVETFGPEYIKWFTSDNGPFYFMNNENINKLSPYIEYQEHSGCSFACTMRNAQFILNKKYNE